MGFRTVVMLSNDHAHEWEKDAALGQKIRIASSMGRHQKNDIDGYGKVVEVVHADCQTLAVLDGYEDFNPVAAKGWVRGESDEETTIRLLKEAADKLGYRLTKKSAAKNDA